MKIKVLALLILIPTSLFAQGGFVRDIVLQRRVLTNPSITYAQPVNGATVRVCTGGGIPCTPLASIFNDAGLSSTKSNPTSTDINGNFSFWAAPGPYTVGITVGGVTTNYEYTVDYTNPASIATNIGSTNQIIFNNGSIATGSQDFTWDDATKTLTIKDSSHATVLRFGNTTGAGRILFGSGTVPSITDVTDWQFTSRASPSAANFGNALEERGVVLNVGGVPGTVTFGRGSSAGDISLNDTVSAAGTFLGPKIRAGNGSPEAAVTARIGSIFLRADGGGGTNVYTKQTGTGNTGWSSLPVLRGPTGTAAPNSFTVIGTCTLGTDCAVTLTGAAVFTSSTSYTCNAQDQSAAAATRVVQSSGSAFTVTGTGTDVIRYSCEGN
jgi:hypothetical protein